MKNFGYSATNVYQIIYAKDGEGAAEYDYYVTPDEASAGAGPASTPPRGSR